MKNLKTLIVKTSSFSKPLVHLPNSLKVLEWHGLQDIPSDFLPKNLSICKLPNSSLTSFKLANSLKERVIISPSSSCIQIHYLLTIHFFRFGLSFLQMFLGMKVLHLDKCYRLTEISDVSSLQNLEEFSFRWCKNLLTIHDSVGCLKKLKILKAEGCSNLKSFPPIQLTSLELLELSYCYRLKKFPEILVKMENIVGIDLEETSIDELPDSFQNLIGIQYLILDGHGIFLRFPCSTLMMPKMSSIDVQHYCLLPKQSDKPISMVSSNVQVTVLTNCNLTDESLPIVLRWFTNVTYLHLSKSNFTILPECIEEHHSLRILNILFALNCESLSSSCRSMLLNQVLCFLYLAALEVVLVPLFVFHLFCINGTIENKYQNYFEFGYVIESNPIFWII